MESNKFESSAHAADSGTEGPSALSSDMENQFFDLTTKPYKTRGQEAAVPKVQSNELVVQSLDLPPIAPVAEGEVPKVQSNELVVQSLDLPPIAPVAEGEVPKVQSNELVVQSLDLPPIAPVAEGEIPDVNKLSIGATAVLSNKHAIPNRDDLCEINSMLGGDWRNLALVISMDNNKKMIGIPEMEAKQKVIIHFAAANEKQRKKLEVPFDVTFGDLITRIQHLLSADIHWLCLAYCLEEEDTVKMIRRIYDALPDFNTFWAAFSMPHYGNVPEVEDRYEQNIKQAGNDERVFVDELKALRTEVERQDRRHELPPNAREFNKFCHFLTKENLLKYATYSKNELDERFKQLSKMKVDKSTWRKYLLDKFGIRQFKTKKPGKHYCITYRLQNLDCIGEQVIAKNNCVGSLGWRLENEVRAKCQLTSSHVLLNEKRFLFLGQRENLNRIVELEHTMLSRFGKKIGIGCDLECFCFSKEIVGVIISGCYKIGDNISPGMEIAVIKTGNQYRLIDQDVPAGFIYYQWKTFEFPDTLYFNCQVKHHDEIELDLTVYKFGTTTGLTKGNITDKKCTFKFHYPFTQNKENPLVVTLNNQYEVAWDECPFSGEGDSGGPVFTINKESGEIKAIGVLTGNNETKQVSFVTPLHQVQKVFSAKYKLQNFEVTLSKRPRDLSYYWPNCATLVEPSPVIND